MEKNKEESFSRGLVWLAPGQVDLVKRPIPDIGNFEALVEVKACAICGSDLRIVREGNGRISPGRILGHEISGVVVKIGSQVKNLNVGDRITTAADIPCGECEFCKNGPSNCCRTNLAMGYQFDGGFADHVVLPEQVIKYGPLQKINQDLDFEIAALAEPAACCLNGYEQALADKLKPKSVLIFGAGPIGALLALMAPLFGIQKVVMVDPSEDRRQSMMRLGLAPICFDSQHPDIDNLLSKESSGKGFDLIFTACPDVAAHDLAIKNVAVRGVVNLFGGVPKNSRDISLNSNFIHYREAYITGSHGSTPRQHQRALEWIEQGRLNVRPLISAKYRLEEYQSAFKAAASGENLKVIITPNV
jgi:L-iditol 2-dehydrogenase